ncbi:hypothetical protein HOK68_00075 [Candidatus Woesearchaeota archaeon]|jgi:hypothetical protein|nr:hypothetical protein [Candidatus Woesearchaeota archaeon]MBT4387525.1 hypothetical protein [Candidatus Woesearchaeota archaeon]MBT4595367.1 hypothetical protein [Candidatus Woesearchaeota archaeon]MBT5741228.1 hypothetical protein [Candidatus Woesearchaeota archaeon]MBT6505158.1 hypothetical protein [Candidatus Woesearchaeota archaeon]
MGEKRKIFTKKIEYSGLLDLKDLHKVIKDFFESKQYGYDDPEYEETAKEDSKSFKMKIEFEKDLSDYLKHIFKIKFEANEIKNVEVERAEHKVLMQDAKIKIEIEGIIETDYGDAWNFNKNWFFIKTVFNKIVMSKELEPDNELMIQVGNELLSRIKGFLNLYQY